MFHPQGDSLGLHVLAAEIADNRMQASYSRFALNLDDADWYNGRHRLALSNLRIDPWGLSVEA